jgi:hypothetical protein
MRWVALAGILGVLWLVTPPDLAICGFRRLTGRPCPLCGLTHAVFALARGHVGDALRFHALSPLAILMGGGTLWNARWMARCWTPCLAAFGIYGAWRLIL